MKKIAFFLIFISLIIELKSQVRNDFFFKKESSHTGLHGELDFLGYFRNNEYFTKINPGQTYLGWQLLPKVHYIKGKTQLSGGVFAQRAFGLDTTLTKPYLRIQTQLGKWSITFGSIDNTLKHNLIEPLMDYESFFYDRLEQGFEIEYKDSTKSLDVWLDWEEAVTRNSDNQERFFVGVKAEKLLVNKPKFELWLPLSTSFYHQGGSINNTEKKVSTRQGTAGGLLLNFGSKDRQFTIDNRFLFANDFSPTLSHTFENGYAIYSNLGFKTQRLQVLASYWYGEEFYIPKAGPLFNSVSIEGQTVAERIRELIFLRGIYSQNIDKNTSLELRLEPYYDLVNSEFEYSIGAYLRYNLSISKKDF